MPSLALALVESLWMSVVASCISTAQVMVAPR